MNYSIICLREKNGRTIPIPIMESDDDGDQTGAMATWEEYDEAVEFCGSHILCSSSQNIIIDLNTGYGIII